jgi:hypothetical protein
LPKEALLVSFVLRSLLVCCAAALLLVPAAPAGSNVVPYAGFYDCRAKDGFTHLHSIQLRVNGRYVQGIVDASGRRFKSVTGSGRFSRSGSRLTFHSGPMRPNYAIVKTPRRFGVWVKGERNYSYYCYYTNKN